MIRLHGLLLLLLTAAAAATPTEQEVDYLIKFVADSGCAFYRNNSAHDSVAAAEHLRNKYRQGKRWVISGDRFIDRIASGSTLSGKPYHVVCEGVEMTSANWLRGALEQHREAMRSQ